MPPTRLTTAVLAITMLLGSVGCATRFNADAHVDNTYDFSGISTFAFSPERPERAAKKNGQLLESAIRRELLARGYHEVKKADAGVLISYEVGVQSPARLSGANKFDLQEGGITVRFMDPPTRKTVWYGWSDKTLSKDDTAELAIPEAVKALFDGRIPNAPH